MDNRRLMTIYKSLDRSLFIPQESRRHADLDAPLSIGYGQTISQPSLVLAMTRWLSPERTSRVLEIGTGSGYQTALLANMADQVYTVERIPQLSKKARERLHALGLENIHFRIEDGSEGWSDFAPYDRIMVTAAAGKIPESLIEQLSPNGRMIIPVGPEFVQDLLLIIRDESGHITSQTLEMVRFVELKGRYGWRP